MGRRIDPRQLDLLAVADANVEIAAFEPVETSPGIVDLTPLIDAVQVCIGGRRIYGRLAGAAGDEAERRLAEWHGFKTTRLHLEPTFETIVLADVGKFRKASAYLVVGPRGLWLFGYDFQAPESGSGTHPRAWSWSAYTTREAAIRAVAAKGVEYYTGVSRKDCAKVLKSLQAIVDGKPVAQAAKDATAPAVGTDPQPGDAIRIGNAKGVGNRTYRVTGRSDDGTLRVQPLTTYAPTPVWGKERSLRPGETIHLEIAW